jgi:protocatechuate 3,4-dioxygenase beta subunit
VTVTVCDDSTGPLTIALIQIWQDRGRWKSTTLTTTTQNHSAGCGTHTVGGPLAARSVPKMWIAAQVTDGDGRQSSLRTAPAP